MSGLRLLDLVKPFLPILPEIESPLQRVQYEEKLVWTVCIGLAYYVLGEISIHGVTAVDNYDPLFWLRPVLASTKGTLLELGLSPVLTSGIIFQLLGGLQLIDVNFDFKSDRELYQSAQKLLAIVLTVVQAVSVLFSGLYGSPFDMGLGSCLMFLVQIIGPGMFIIFADEIMQKGYSWGTGAAFFTVLKVSQEVFWRAFSLQTNDFGRGKEFTGSFVALVHSLMTRNFKNALMEAFYRTHLPNLFESYVSFFTLAAAIYLISLRIDLPVKSTKVRTPGSTYPIRLLYTGTMPLLLVVAIVSNVFLVSQALYAQFPDNLLVRLFGTWAVVPGSSRLTAVSGLSYYLTPPFGLAQALWDPIKTLVYAAFLLIVCSLFGKTWADLSGGSPKDVAKTFKSQGIVIVGHRDTAVVKELRRIIPSAASIGGSIVALLSLSTDLLGATGLGTASVVAATTIYNYFEILAQEGGIPNGFVPGQ